MGTYNIHGGHSLICRGAAKYLDEVDEDRKVKNKVIELLRKEGHTVYDCTDDKGTDATGNLVYIVDKCNKHKVDLDVSIHLNAGEGTGPEVWIYNEKNYEVASRVSEKIAKALEIRNRGVKYSTKLYVLRNTISPAMLIECCFVDSTTDKNAWDVDKCAKAIVEGILNKEISDGVLEQDNCDFKVKFSGDTLPIRKGPGSNYKKTGYTGEGVFTIVAVKTGKGSTAGWGELKSGAGWINLSKVKKL